MFKEPIESTISPSSLTDIELLRFAEEFASNGTMPQSFQQELVKRLHLRII
jgi:hypothetical protein